jgi:hypothetical protein
MYYPIYTERKHMVLRNKKRRYTQDTPSANTTPDQFKVIDDVKDEPTLKEAQEFVGGIC